jgi:D-alanyl-D-alanine carboxypeptidase
MLWTCGALYSTAENMARYSRALFNRALFTQSSLDQMLTWIPYPHNPALGYGFGILIIPDFVPGVLAYGHDGTVPGYKGRWAYLPDHGVHIVVFLNEDNYDCLTAITTALADVALEH